MIAADERIVDQKRNGVPLLLACPICKILSWRRALCRHCAAHLHARLEPFERELERYNISSLFTWERDRWPGLGWWVHALKTQENPRFWREPAVWSLDLFQIPKGPTWLIPVPSKRRFNHARGFARAIGDWSGFPVCELLRAKPGQAAQKRLSRRERGRRAFERDYAHILPRGKQAPALILVDDVITTGATAEAAYRALGRPRDFRVWCLMDRRPCGPPPALL